MRGIEQDQSPFYSSSESELELFIRGKVAVAAIQNIIVDQSYRFKFPQRSESKKTDVFLKVQMTKIYISVSLLQL